MKHAITALAVAACSIAAIDSAQSANDTIGIYMSGQELNKDCRLFLRMRQVGHLANADEIFSAGECYGFVVGLLDKSTVEAFTKLVTPQGIPRTYCPSEGVNANDAAEVVARYLDEHPEKRSMGGYFLAREALAKAYPC